MALPTKDKIMARRLNIDDRLVLPNKDESGVFQWALNNAGFTLVEGMVVVLDSAVEGQISVRTAVSSGTASSDDKDVWGVVASGSVPNLDKVLIQRIGHRGGDEAGTTVRGVRVDGTTDIAIGEWLGTGGLDDYSTGAIDSTTATTAFVGDGTTFTAAMVGRFLFFRENTGTITATAASTTITGSGSAFVAQMVGEWLQVANEEQRYKIASVTSTTVLVLSDPYQGSTAAGLSYTIQPDTIYEITAYTSATAITVNTAVQETMTVDRKYVITAPVAIDASSGKGGNFAMALEAYATNDSAGNIRAILDLPARLDVATAADASATTWGASDDLQIYWGTGDASNHAAVVGIGNTSQQIHITDVAAMATDWARTAGTHPELAIHSNTTPATDYVAIGNHDGTTATVDVVGGTTLNLNIAGTTEVILTGASLDLASADLQMQTGGQILDNSGLELVEFVAVGLATNGIRISNNSTGLNPIITNEGEADTGLTLAGWDGTTTEEILILDANATAVNELTIDNAATGAAPSIAATGGDTNISLTLTAKGTGVIQTTQPLTQERSINIDLDDTATVTVAQIMKGIADCIPTAAATFTLPTAALLVAGIANAQVGDSFSWFVNNASAGANTITVTAGASGTADGTMTVAQGVVRQFVFLLTNVTGAAETYSVWGIGT